MPSSPSTHKKVAVRKLDNELVKGYINPQTYITPGGVQLLDREGRIVTIPLEFVKGVYFVRDFDSDEDRRERKAYLTRPKLDGLWVRLTFKDGEVMEGLMPRDLLAADPRGFTVTPPDLNSNHLHIFVPRSALTALEVLGVIANGARRRFHLQAASARRKAAGTSGQIRLFPPPTSEGE